MVATRWEFCPYCYDGFPNYLGLKKGFHEFECSMPEHCGAWFKVEKNKGNFDLREGMELNEKSIYLLMCDSCKKLRPVKILNLRFICASCSDTMR